MACNLSKYELYILKRIIYDKSRWCNKHISREDLSSGNPVDERHLYKEAIDSLIRKGYLKQYKSQNRVDFCANKAFKHQFINFFQTHESEHLFLQGLDFSKMK